MRRKKNIERCICKSIMALGIMCIMSAASMNSYAQESETEEIMFEEETAEAIEVERKGETYTIYISGEKNYDIAHEVAEFVNKQRALNGMSEMILNETLVEECMLYGAERLVGSVGTSRPNGMSSDEVLASSQETLQMQDIKIMAAAYAVDTHYKNSRSIGIGCFFDGSLYHVSVMFGDTEGSPLKKTGSESTVMGVELLKEWATWRSREKNIYLKAGEFKTLEIEIGCSKDGVFLEDGSMKMENRLFEWKSEDSTIAEINSDGKVTGKKPGSTTVSAIYDGQIVYQWDIRVNASEEVQKECVTTTVSGTRHYEYTNQALIWINEWRAKEGLSPVTISTKYDEVVWQQAIQNAIRFEKSPSTGISYSGTQSYSTNGCGYGVEYYRWMHDTSNDVLDPNHKSVAIACFQNEYLYFWSIIWSDEAEPQRDPIKENKYVHENVSVLRDHLVYRGLPSKNLKYHPGDSEQLVLYQGFLEEGETSFYPQVLMDSAILTWKSSNSSVVSVSKNGKISALKDGTVTITASYNGSVLFQWNVEVKTPVEPKKVQVTYTGTQSYTEFKKYEESEYKQFFTILADGKEVFDDEFYINYYQANDDKLIALGLAFQGDYTGTYIFYLEPLDKVTGLKATSAGKNKVKLSWKAVEDAEGYLIYGQKNGVYGYVGRSYDTSFTDTKALDSEYNFYWVFAYRTDYNGKMHPGGCEKYVYAKGVSPAVTNLKASSVKGGVKLSWTAAAGAEGYLIYGIENGGTYGYVGMTKGTTFTAKKASKTVYNFYWIFPYHKNAAGKMITGGVAPYTYGRAK